MSRLAKKSILLPEGVNAQENNRILSIKGPKGELNLPILPLLKIELLGKAVKISPSSSVKQSRANCGTMWSLTKNALEGVTQGFSKILEIEGIGYRVGLEDRTLVLNLGFVNPVRFELPEGVSASVDKNAIKIEGIDKSLVGQTASEIRSLKKPEPYKGKGIRYRGEVIRRKSGKKAVATAT